MLKEGAQKGGPKGENKWLKHQSAHACAVQTQLATFHENSEYPRKCLHFVSTNLRLVRYSEVPEGTSPVLSR
jgi:hypothetical protein